MRMKLMKLLFVLAVSPMHASALYHTPQAIEHTECVWQENTPQFRELLFSFNALMPAQGHYDFYLQVHGNGVWSPWELVVHWGNSFRGSVSAQNEFFTFSCDTLKTLMPCDGFSVCVRPCNGAPIEHIKCMYMSTRYELPGVPAVPLGPLASVQLPVECGQSQMMLPHPRRQDLCSPTSCANVLSYVLNAPVDPLWFAELAYDDAEDIYGNWMLNIAAAYAASNGSCPCHVQRLDSFVNLHSVLSSGSPVVVSVQGPLPGGATPYANGHLMMVYGYDAAAQEVLCIDSAFLTNDQTFVRYQLYDFLVAWARRGNLAYVFTN